MAVEFFESHNNSDYVFLKKHMDEKITKDVVDSLNNETQDQATNIFWHYLRQGRLTGSKLHEAAHCKTDGVLVQQILGGYKVPETQAIKRGKRLEPRIIAELEKKLKVDIKKTGFILIDSVVGASPDGVTKDFVIEIKCPISAKTFKNYIRNNELTEKVKAQINSQMKATGLKKGLFCVADPSFELTKELHLYWTELDEIFLNNLLDKALHFWERFVYPKVIQAAMCK